MAPRGDNRHLLPARLLGVLMSVVVVSVGLLAVVTRYSPSVATRFGVTAPVFGGDAAHVGATVVLIGLFPLAFLMPTARWAGGWAATCLGLAMLHALFGASLWA